jgi:hypothetical protein
MDTKALREKILDLAIRGKLVPQDPNDEPASLLLERIRAQKQQMVKDGKLKAKDIKDDTVIFKGEDNLHYEKFTDGTVKCIEDEIPFDLPKGWEWSKINNIAFVTKLAGFEYSKYIAPTLCEDGIPLFKGKNVQDSKIIYEFESFIPENISDELSRSQITRKCILTPYVGTIGNIGIHDKVGKFHLGSNVGKIELYNSCVVLMEEYVVTYLKGSFGYKQLTKYMKATAQSSISIEAIRDVYIPIPPENEQQRMWSAISELLALIENIESYEGDIADMVKLAKSKILDLAIHGKLVPQDPNDEPASVLLERIRAEKEELIRQGKIKRDKKDSVIFKGEDNSYYEKVGSQVICIDSEIPFELPDGWMWCRLGTIGEWRAGTTPNRSNPEYYNGNIPWLKTGDLTDNYITCIPETITDLALKETSIRLNPAGSVLIAMYGATIGKLGMLTFPAATNQACCACFPLDGIEIEYLFYYLLSQRDYFINRGVGGAQSNISKEKIIATLMPVPPYTEQKRLLEDIKALNEIISNIEQNLS